MNYHGAMLLKVLFDFRKPSKLVKSLLSLSLEEVLILANDPMGSHAVEAFLKSKSVPSDDKNILIQKFQVTSTYAFPGYQKGTRGFFSRAAGCVVVGRRWTHLRTKAEVTSNLRSGKDLAFRAGHYNDSVLTTSPKLDIARGKSLAPRVTYAC